MRIRWRGLELPSLVNVDRANLTATYGKFTAEPFERGFGVTIGNSLRRILLSSLEGSSVTQIKLHGAQHEFSTLPGILEDVTDIVLNVKALVVKNHSEQTRVIRIEKSSPGPITGADVIADDQIEVINKEHHLATLTESVPFVLEMVVENGRGYVPATEHTPQAQEIGIIPVDALYSPVVRVRYEVEETRVGQKTNYDRLTMEIWTNGSISPELALVESAKILRKHLNPFIQYAELGPAVHSEGRSIGNLGVDPSLESKLNMSLAELALSVRATNCLESENITSVRDLVSRNEDQLLDVRNFGETTLTEVREKTGRYRPAIGHETFPLAHGNPIRRNRRSRVGQAKQRPTNISGKRLVGLRFARSTLRSREPDNPEPLRIPCDIEEKAASSAAIQVINGRCCAIWPAPCSSPNATPKAKTISPRKKAAS